MRTKILSLLVLLLTAASGAWAQTLCIDFEDNALPQGWTHYGTTNNWYVAGINSWNNVSAYAGSYSLYIDANGNYNNDYFVSPAINFQGAGSLSFAYATKDWSGDHNDLTIAYSTSPTGPWTKTSFENQSNNDWTTATVDLSFLNGTYYIAFVSYDNYGFCTAIDNINLVGSAETIEVTTNKAEGETTFTEATFEMPAFDATAEYEMVRDMSVQMTTKVGDGADGADYRIRLKKDGTAWALADITLDALKALITVHDGIEDKNLAYYGQDAVCALQIFAVDDNDQPTGNAIDFANLTPGRYVAKAVAADGSDYVGETAFSNVIVLFQGYEVTVPAKEFITYYKEENLKLDAETSAAGELYTVSTVTDNSVVLSNKLNVVPANSPMLVYNPTDEEKTFLLIPTDETLLGFMYYAGFKGTLVATTIAASTDAQTNYAFNGMAFVYVKNAISIAANKAWLEVAGAENNVRALTIVFGADTATGIANTVPTDDSNVVWYDLNGRKIGKKPTQKGVYILNGKKVAVK